MTIEEAIAHAKEQKEIFGGVHKEFLEVAIEALEKQIPKKPIETQDIEGINDFYCKKCSRIVGDDTYKFLYCPKCGYAIDWSEEE